MKISQLHGQEIIKPAPKEDDRVENAVEAVGMGRKMQLSKSFGVHQ